MGKRLIALYKAYRGGEWFRASLESVQPHTDGAVIVFGTSPWLDDLQLPENCTGPMQSFCKAHSGYPIVTSFGKFQRQEDQYNAGLDAIREEFGEDAAVLVVDTDEIWDSKRLSRVRRAITGDPNCDGLQYGLRCKLRTYLKSPLYQVWPPESAGALVALRSPNVKCELGRFRNVASAPMKDEVWFHHFSYVREDPRDIEEKFHATSSQEGTPSNPKWLTDVWPRLPLGTDLHMTPNSEPLWKQIKIISPASLPPVVRDLPFIPQILRNEDLMWRDWLRHTPVEDQLLPVPTWQIDLYRNDLQLYLGEVNLRVLETRMKTSYLELLTLCHWASQVAPSGVICEVGCGHGASTTCLAGASDASVRVDAVDPFAPYDELAAWGLTKGVTEGNEANFLNTLEHYGLRGKVKHLPYLSEDVKDHLDPGGYDLVFIDANHSFSHVAHDLKLMWPHLKPGGVLVGHDYTTRFPGVMQAADEFPDADFLVAAGTSLFYARKEQ